MSGGEPPLPPSRPPYHSWHGRPTHRRRGGPPGSARNTWAGRRPRSPPHLSTRPRHLRPPYKPRHVPQTPPAASQSQHHSISYHPHGPPSTLSRGLQGRLRSPPRSPARHPDLSTHRADSQPYRGEPGPSHRVEPLEHLPFRGPDPSPFRPPPLKSRGDSFSFSSERPSLRGPSDHPPPYRGEPGPLYRADSVPHRDEFEPRRGLGGIGGGGVADGLSSRADGGSQYAPWFRHPGKIHKTLKPKKRRPPPHIVSALRASGPYLSRPQSPILSRIGMPVGERGTSGSRIGMGSTIGPMRKGQGPNLSSPKLSQELSSTSSRSNTHDPHAFGPSKQRRSLSSPQNIRSISSPTERTNNDRQKLQPNGPARADSETQEGGFPKGPEKRPRTPLAQEKADVKSFKEESTNGDTVCNGMDWSHANGPSDPEVKKSAENDVKPSGAVAAVTASEVGSKEANGLKPEKIVAEGIRTGPTETKPASETKQPAETQNGPVEMKKEKESRMESQASPKLKQERTISRVPSSSRDIMKVDDQPSKSDQQEECSALEVQPCIPQPDREPVESSTKKLLSELQPEHDAQASEAPKNLTSTPKSRTDPSSNAILSADPGKELPSAIPTLSVPKAPIPVPAPAMSLLRSTPRARTRSSSFEDKLRSLKSFTEIASSPWPPSLPVEFLRGSATKTGLASSDLVRQIHEVEGKITAIARTIAELRNTPLKMEASLSSPSPATKVESKSVESPSERYSALARKVEASADAHITRKPAKRSRHPLHSEARRLLVKNQCVAAASHAKLRTLCSDVELGLNAVEDNLSSIGGEVSAEVRSKVAEYLKRKRAVDFAKRRKLGKKYAFLMRSWHEGLTSARENRTKEKRDALRERDRYILLCTKGTSALLTSRTSSGRTSTKVVPSVGANGQTNGTAELDQMLADIEAEGGTPGSRLTWSKTLAEIPDQDASRPPLDCYSILMTDPVAEHHAARAANPWRFEEVLVFLDKYLTCSKNFMKIASFLEHKSPRDCSYFYYMNKLRLGLKQLTKEASALKRRGTLRRHLLQIAKQFSFLDPNDQSEDSFQVSVQNAVAGSAAEKFMVSGDVTVGGFLAMGSNRQGYSLEKRELRDLPLKRSEQIMIDVKAIDLTGIDRRPFAQAFAMHGTDWTAIGSHLGLPGKSSTHYREFFRRNKKKLVVEDLRDQGRARLLLPSRSPNLGPRMSPRMSPRGSPRHSCLGNRIKLSDASEVESPDTIQFDDTDNDEVATRILLRDDKDGVELQAKEEVSHPKNQGEAPARGTNRRERDTRKGKPTATWSADECVQFRVLFKEHGRDWKAIARLMAPKTPTQIKGYWRTVAHEVGDGLTGESLRSRSERKRMKRRTSSETLSRHSPTASQDDVRTSPKVKSPRVRDREEAGAEENGQDFNRREGMNDVGEEGDSERRKDLTTVSKDPFSYAKSDSGQQGGTPTEVATSEERPDTSKVRLPMLRSLPIPGLRSMPRPSGKSESGKDTSNGAVSSTSEQMKNANVTTSEDELRKAAESYGVLELLGNQLHDTRDGETKPKAG